MAGTVAVLLHDRLTALKWLSAGPPGDQGYEVTKIGVDASAQARIR